MRHLLRDPFARASFVRQTEPAADGCAWCGTPGRRGRLFRYGWEPDSIHGRIGWDDRLFCCRSCRRCYYG